MKKILSRLAGLALTQLTVLAWFDDYTSINFKEAKYAQKFGTTNKYFATYEENAKEDTNTQKFAVKDPHLISFNKYSKIDNTKFNAKIQQDEVQYKKIKDNLRKNKTDDFNTQAYSMDFYKVYRIAERIIRANNLDYINWRISIQKTPDGEFNASSSSMNYIVINTGLYDTLNDNDDALAFVIGHEMAHQLLGHGQRTAIIMHDLRKAYSIADDNAGQLAVVIKQYKANSQLQKMEYSADVEGAILALKAGYNLDTARETLSFINTLPYVGNLYLSHPKPEKRLKNFSENRKFFIDDAWSLEGQYNIYNSKVLPCVKSSDRTSIVISRGEARNKDSYYRPETISEMLLRYAYISYINCDFKNAEKYFSKLISKEENNPVVYLYLSYTYEYLYKQTGKDKYLEKAKEAAEKGLLFKPNDKYLKEQIAAL